MEVDSMKNSVIICVKVGWLGGDRNLAIKVSMDENTIRDW
jgi:hypothetical protein